MSEVGRRPGEHCLRIRSRIARGRELPVVERYRLIDGGKMMEVAISVEDRSAFTMPWSAMQRFRRVPREWSEDICADAAFAHHLDYEVVPLPQAATSDF